MNEIISSAVNSILRLDELHKWWIDDSTSGLPPARPSNQKWLHVKARNEVFDLLLYDSAFLEETEHDLKNRIMDALRDWVAESRFGWGQQR